jgi:hypothetical protein
MPLQQLQKLQRLDLRSQLPDDEDNDRVSKGKRSGEVVSGRCYQIGKGVGAVLLLEMCMFIFDLLAMTSGLLIYYFR